MRFDRTPGLQIEHQTPAPEAPLRLDVPVFVGVAPRGPARVPVVDARWSADAAMLDPLAAAGVAASPSPIESLDAYRRRFGEIEAGAYLGRAVAAFFAQGGRRCWVMRIVARAAAAPSGRGVGRLLAVDGQAPGLGFVARDEGAWGNKLLINMQLHSDAAPLRFDGGDWFSLAPAQTPVGSLLRWRAGPGPWQLARVEACGRQRQGGGDRWRLQLDSPMPVGCPRRAAAARSADRRRPEPRAPHRPGPGPAAPACACFRTLPRLAAGLARGRLGAAGAAAGRCLATGQRARRLRGRRRRLPGADAG